MARGLRFRIQKVEGLYYLCSKNKGADQLGDYHEADLGLCFRICKMLVFSQCSSYANNKVVDQMHIHVDCQASLLLAAWIVVCFLSKISRPLWTVYTGLYLSWSESMKTGFLVARLKCILTFLHFFPLYSNAIIVRGPWDFYGE